MKLEFFEPAMCCSTGLCGPNPDKTLIQLRQDINNVKEKYPDIVIERYMITQQPLKFRENDEIYRLIRANDQKVLPITAFNGKVIKTHRYPTIDELIEVVEGENI